jgi:hypothetical protein
MICLDTVAVLKEYNIRRHNSTKHDSEFKSFTGQLRIDKYALLEKNKKKTMCCIEKKNNFLFLIWQ